MRTYRLCNTRIAVDLYLDDESVILDTSPQTAIDYATWAMSQSDEKFGNIEWIFDGNGALMDEAMARIVYLEQKVERLLAAQEKRREEWPW